MTQVTYSSSELGFDRSWVSAAALDVIDTLQQAGFDGYLVGGCVRDPIMDRHPKDFDVTTNANPDEVRKLFRRAKVIGRRFKIVHVRYGREIVEVATYRAKPGNEKSRWSRHEKKSSVAASGRVIDDNIFGTIEQDAERRDFTINALYYDPNAETVIDFVGGVEDAERNLLRMIGDARERFTEDPVRMLRTLRFKAKLEMQLEDGLEEAILECTELLEDVPGARMFDEVIKMFHHGHAVESWHELFDHDMIPFLFPLTARHMGQGSSGAAEELVLKVLESTDRRVHQDKPVIPAFLFTALLWMPFKQVLEPLVKGGMPHSEAVWEAGDKVFAQQSPRVAVPRRVSATVIEIWEMQAWLERRRPKTVRKLLENRRFRAAYDFLVLREEIGEVSNDLVEWWTRIQECEGDERQRMISRLGGQNGAGQKKKSRKRRPRNRSNRQGGGNRAGNQVNS